MESMNRAGAMLSDRRSSLRTALASIRPDADCTPTRRTLPWRRYLPNKQNECVMGVSYIFTNPPEDKIKKKKKTMQRVRADRHTVVTHADEARATVTTAATLVVFCNRMKT